MQKNYFMKNVLAASTLLALSMGMSSCSGFVDAVIGSTDQPSSTPTQPSTTPTTPQTATLTIDQTTMTLEKGATGTIKVTANTSDGEISCSSTNTTVATVTKVDATTFTVTAGTAITGIATITISTAATANFAAAEAKCELTVTEANVNVESVTLDKTELTLKVGDDDVTLTATVKPDEATNKELDWVSSDVSVATVSSLGEVHAVADGTATITAKAKDGSGVKATCTITVEAAGISLNLTNPQVGQIIGDDGKNYDDVSGTRGGLPSDVTPVAKIAYLDPTGHGIALAIDDESEKMTYADAKAAPQSRKPVFNNASWDTILIDTWEAMSNTAGGYTNLASKFNFKKDTYWLGNQNADGTAWCIKYSNSGVNVIENASKDETHYVRLLLIF